MKKRVIGYSIRRISPPEVPKTPQSYFAFDFKKHLRTPLPQIIDKRYIMNHKWQNSEELLPLMRSQQIDYFVLIQKVFSDLLSPDYYGFSLDIPLAIDGKEMQLFRYVERSSSSIFLLLKLDCEPVYYGQPFWPRLIKKHLDSMEEETIPNFWREKALTCWKAEKGGNKPAFGNRPTELLRAYYENPDIKTQGIRSLMGGISQYTLANHRSKIGELIKQRFAITLPTYGFDAARYWVEMGLAL